MTFSHRSNMIRHKRNHTEEKPFACDVCGRTFSVRFNMIRHKRRTHADEDPFRCDMCEKLFHKKAALILHKRTHTVEKKRLDCAVCGRTYLQESFLVRHMRTHDGGKASRDACPKTGATRGNTGKETREVHIRGKKSASSGQRMEEPRSSDCTGNVKELTSETASVDPDQSQEDSDHSGQPPPAQQAPTSDKTDATPAVSNGKLSHMHMRLPPRGKPHKSFWKRRRVQLRTRGSHQCDSCRLSFFYEGVLRAHQRAHQAQDHFLCDVCPKIFDTCGKLVAHFQRVHC